GGAHGDRQGQLRGGRLGVDRERGRLIAEFGERDVHGGEFGGDVDRRRNIVESAHGNLPADGEIGGPDRAQGADGHDVGDREHEGGLAGGAHVPFRDEVGHRLLATLAVETGAPHDRFPAAAGGETLGETGDAVIGGADPLARGEDDRAPIAQPDHLGAQQPGPAAVVHSEPTYVRVVVVAEGDDGGPGGDEVGGGLGDRGAGAGGGEDDRPRALA